MSHDLDDLLLLWQERRDRGDLVTPEELCSHSAPQAAELTRRIRHLVACDKLLGMDESDDDSPFAAAVAVDRVPTHIGAYEIKGVLGHGGAGIVYRGRDLLLQLPVAIKMLRPTLLLDVEGREELLRRLQQEALVLARLRHPHIVRVHTAVLHEGQICLVLEYVEGGNLAEQRERFRDPARVARLMEHVARAVHYAHESGLMHRDLKPANILLDAQGEPRVSDFGLAKLLHEPVETPEPTGPVDRTADTWPGVGAMTLPGRQPGTVPYMAPEQFDPAVGPLGPRIDVWAIGIILYELLTGQRPFTGSDYDAVRHQVCSKPLMPRGGLSDMERRLERIALRCLEKSPERRFASALEIANELAAAKKRSIARRTLLALTGMVCVAAVLVYNLRPASVQEVYLRAVARMQERLQRGETAVLIEPGQAQAPAHVVHNDQGGTRISHTPDGFKVYTSGRYSFVELLPSVPIANYEISARVRLDMALTLESRWGLYFRHVSHQTSQGVQHHYIGLRIDDDDPPGRNEARGEKKWRYQATFSPYIFGLPTDALFRDCSYTVVNQRNFMCRELPIHPTGEWRTLTATVTPTADTILVEDADLRFSLPAITREIREEAIGTFQKTYPDLQAIPAPGWNGSALGLFFREVACTVERFEVRAR